MSDYSITFAGCERDGFRGLYGFPGDHCWREVRGADGEVATFPTIREAEAHAAHCFVAELRKRAKRPLSITDATHTTRGAVATNHLRDEAKGVVIATIDTLPDGTAILYRGGERKPCPSLSYAIESAR